MSLRRLSVRMKTMKGNVSNVLRSLKHTLTHLFFLSMVSVDAGRCFRTSTGGVVHLSTTEN